MRSGIVALLLLGAVRVGMGATAVATYEFNNNFNADQVGPSALTVSDPLGTSAFQTDTVFGTSRTVWVASPSRSRISGGAREAAASRVIASPTNCWPIPSCRSTAVARRARSSAPTN